MSKFILFILEYIPKEKVPEIIISKDTEEYLKLEFQKYLNDRKYEYDVNRIGDEDYSLKIPMLKGLFYEFFMNLPQFLNFR